MILYWLCQISVTNLVYTCLHWGMMQLLRTNIVCCKIALHVIILQYFVWRDCSWVWWFWITNQLDVIPYSDPTFLAKLHAWDLLQFPCNLSFGVFPSHSYVSVTLTLHWLFNITTVTYFHHKMIFLLYTFRLQIIWPYAEWQSFLSFILFLRFHLMTVLCLLASR